MLNAIYQKLAMDLDAEVFSPPVACVYNPLAYAWKPFERYLELVFGANRRPRILLLGMNPGPFGMAQTGVPFGDVVSVRDWLGIHEAVGHPHQEHPKRPVQGFACGRREVSGARLWGWARRLYGKPEAFFEQFVVLNYCPLCFMEDSGRNRTPDKLPVIEREALFARCDEALRHVAETMAISYAIGIGMFAESRLRVALSSLDMAMGRVPHPSPANPAANRGWESLMDSALAEMGIATPPG